MLLTARPAPAPARRAAGRRGAPRAARASAAPAAAGVRVADAGVASNRGTARKVNEDRHALEIAAPTPTSTAPWAYAGVYDGHGGAAVADWLVKNLEKYVRREWDKAPTSPEAALTAAFLAADKKLLAPKAGFFGVGERGVGGAKCGSTAAIAAVFTAADGAPTLAAANVGDARVLLRRADGSVTQLSTDHVPDDEDERKRIERTNPNPRLPLVRFVGGTWRVGGLLALSRAFGDAHLKGTDQFEGLSTGGNSYASGFGVTAEPTVTLTPLSPDCTHIIVSSDGLNAHERGGGGGIDNGTAGAIAAACNDAAEAAAALAAAAQEAGSTDDVTVIVLKLA